MKSERTQLASKTLFGNKEPVEVGFNFKLDPGSPNTANWLVLGQLHLAEWTGNLTGYSPPFELGMTGEKMKLTVRYTGTDGKPVAKVVYTDLKNIERGHDYKFDIKAVFDPDGNGRLVVTRDGVVLADYSGPLGYQGQQKVLWGEGLYRDGAATETISAEFGKLDIKTGTAVAMPAKDIFIDAPKLAVDKVGAVAADGLRVVALSGTAKAGTNVAVYNGDTKLGVAKVDADGHYTLSVKVPKGAETALTTIATDATGRSGLQSLPSYIEIGTGAEIGARLKDIVTQGNVASIVVTDGTVLTVSSSIFSYVFKYGQDVLSKIQGGTYSFYQTNPVAGKSYDRIDTYYDQKGNVQQFVRYTKGVETYREINNADGSRHIIDKGTVGQTSILDISKSGVTTLNEQYNADNKLTTRIIKTESGASETHIFDPKTGLEYKYVIRAADGSRVEGNLGLKGRAYTTEIYAYDKAGTMIRQERYEADGTKIFLQTWKADGSKETHFYDGVTGKEINYTVTKADGSRVEVTLKPGQPDQVLKTISYDAAGKVIAQTTGGTTPATSDAATTPAKASDTAPVTVPKPADPVVVAPTPVVSTPVTSTPPATQTPAASKVYVVDAKTKLKTGYTETATDGSKTVVKFTAGDETKLLKKDVFFSNGKPALTEIYDGAGNKTWSAVYKADGSHVNTQYGYRSAGYDTFQNTYDTSDKVIATTRWKDGKVVYQSNLDPDGTRLEKTFATNGTASVTDKNAAGKLLLSEKYDAVGNKTFSAVYKTDGSHVDTQYGIKNAAYDKQQKVYDTAGKVVATTSWAADKVVADTKTAANGSSEAHSYDTAGRQTSATITAVDKSKDVFTFSYASSSKIASTTQQDHYEGTKKVWTDVTDASGAHQQTSYSAGIKLVSHAGVADTFTSGGQDTFVFGKGAGKDVIKNFTVSAATHDTILFDHAGVSKFADLHFTASGHDTVITFGTADSVTLQNVAPTQVKPDFFLFT
ncbi:hypothetical protein F6X38_08970 [Aureimonas leprariae]|uniref:Bacterial Ig domain-containing protein n=2 Tax=Plantimonas leprariae TaxID=2615207 RepID=A0A7V7PQC2_9HYPH|nr:hypothetical protein F6X38_08970 [Aureimonas leprariae]